MLKKIFLKTFLTGGLALLCNVSVNADSKKPNIVFFFTDDQSSNTIGCYGNAVVKTPNIDKLAKQGIRFTNSFVSQPICWVSRTTILTGLTGRSYGTKGNPELARPDAVKTLYSDILRENGYRTGYFGKWHAKMPKGWKAQDHFDEIQLIGRNPFYKKLPDGTLIHETDLIIDRGINFIKTQPKDKPFALNLWFNACHAEDLIDLDEKGLSLDGVLVFQVHVGPSMKVQYKDIRIKHLPDNLPLIEPGESPIPKDAYGVRPQGKLPKDWKAPVYGEQ